MMLLLDRLITLLLLLPKLLVKTSCSLRRLLEFPTLRLIRRFVRQRGDTRMGLRALVCMP
nr:hypothetical protein [Anaplasma phagocytophilum]